jgi:tRNA pseudouridine55 synthase
VRTLAEDLGERLGIGAHLFSLRRTRAGDFKISESKTLEDLEQYVSSNGDVGNALLSLRSALPGMASTQLEDDVAQRVSHGATVSSDERFLDGELVQLCDTAGELIAIGVYDFVRKSIRPRIVLV